MKAEIHPKLNPVVFVDSSCKEEFVTTSTLTSDKTKKIDGVDHYVISIDISSKSHPFYTGKQTLIDTAGRVDKFRARQKAAAKKMEEEEARKAKKGDVDNETPVEKISRKAKENTEKKAAEKIQKAATALKNARAKRAKNEEAAANNEEPETEVIQEAA